MALPSMYWHTMECLSTWHDLAASTFLHAWHILALLGTPYRTLALTGNPWHTYYLFIYMHFNPVLPCISLTLPKTPQLSHICMPWHLACIGIHGMHHHVLPFLSTPLHVGIRYNSLAYVGTLQQSLVWPRISWNVLTLHGTPILPMVIRSSHWPKHETSFFAQ